MTINGMLASPFLSVNELQGEGKSSSKKAKQRKTPVAAARSCK